MNIEDIRNYCLSKRGTTESFPFDNDTLVFKVNGKIFLLAGITANPVSINVKCDPVRAVELREAFPSVTPGYHMSKKHWNTVALDGSVDDKTLCGWIEDSYDLVLNSLSKKQRAEINRF